MLDALSTKMPLFDPFNDPERLFTVHDRLELALELKQNQTAQALQDGGVTGILSCPMEVLDRIFHYVANNHDLAQLCKVSRRFFATALPRLYHTLRITIKPKLDSSIIQMLTRENTGLRFVRRVYASPSRDTSNQVSLRNQCFQIVVNQLPQDTLRELYWLDRDPLPAIIMSTLWQRQKNLQYIEIIPEAGSCLHDGCSEHQSKLKRLKFPDLTAVRAVLKEIKTVRTASLALRQGSVVNLAVDGLFWVGKDPYEYNPEPDDTNPDPDSESEAEDVPEKPDPELPVVDPLTQGLFQHLLRVKPGYTPLFDQLTTLTLRDINLTLSRHTWFTYLKFKRLQHLRIEYCEGADMFLLHLVERFPALQSFHLAHRLNDRSDRTILAIEELLKFLPINQLGVLKLCLRNAYALPSVLSIVKHCDSLEQLQIDVAKKAPAEPAAPPGSPAVNIGPAVQSLNPSNSARLAPHSHQVYSQKDFDFLIKSCTKLRELSIAFPSYTIYFDQFGDSVNSDFSKYINTIVRNLSLCTLNIVNWPTSYKHHRTQGYYKAKNASLARLASAIFKRHRNYNPELDTFDTKHRYSALDIVSFGVNERLSVTSTAPRPAHFLQSTFDAQGVKGFSAQQVDEQDLHKRALDMNIFDYGVRDFDKASRQSRGLKAETGMSPATALAPLGNGFLGALDTLDAFLNGT